MRTPIPLKNSNRTWDDLDIHGIFRNALLNMLEDKNYALFEFDLLQDEISLSEFIEGVSKDACFIPQDKFVALLKDYLEWSISGSAS